MVCHAWPSRSAAPGLGVCRRRARHDLGRLLRGLCRAGPGVRARERPPPVTTRGPSMGDSPEAIPARLARGETADVVILDGGAADELASAGSRARRQQGRSGALADRHGGARRGREAEHRQRRGVPQARCWPRSPSRTRTAAAAPICRPRSSAKLGIADQVARKSRKVRGPPSGEPVAAVVARGEVEIGFQQISELIHVPGVTFVGAIPAELQPRILVRRSDHQCGETA